MDIKVKKAFQRIFFSKRHVLVIVLKPHVGLGLGLAHLG